MKRSFLHTFGIVALALLMYNCSPKYSADFTKTNVQLHQKTKVVTADVEDYFCGL